MPDIWSCGHEAEAMCAQCYRELAAKANKLAEDAIENVAHTASTVVAAQGAQADRMRKALRDIEAWARAYPVKVFPEPDAHDLKKANATLTFNNLPSVDAISASAMRHVLNGVMNIVRDGLGDEVQ